MRIAVVGKGGAGKSVTTGTIARMLARRGERVLTLDSDLVPGLAVSLGAEEPTSPPLNDAAEQNENGRWRLKKGIGPVRAIQRYSTLAPDGVRMLQCGKATAEGRAEIMGAITAFYRVVHRLDRPRTLRDWWILGDLPAGPRQAAFNWAPYAEAYLFVVEPTWQSGLTARRLARLAQARGDVTLLPVANKVVDRADRQRVEKILGRKTVAAVPADDAVVTAERLGLPLIDHAPSSPAARAIEDLVEKLATGNLKG